MRSKVEMILRSRKTDNERDHPQLKGRSPLQGLQAKAVNLACRQALGHAI